MIKKNQIAINTADAKSGFIGGERIDATISELKTQSKKT